MPTRHGDSLVKNANTSLRLSLRATTTLPSASTPWNTFFARSSPLVLIIGLDGPLWCFLINDHSPASRCLVRRRRPHQTRQHGRVSKAAPARRPTRPYPYP